MLQFFLSCLSILYGCIFLNSSLTSVYIYSRYIFLVFGVCVNVLLYFKFDNSFATRYGAHQKRNLNGGPWLKMVMLAYWIC